MKYLKLLLCLLIVSILSEVVVTTMYAQSPTDNFGSPMNNPTRTIGYDRNPSRSGPTSSCFGTDWSNIYHAGDDWFAPKGTAVMAVANGVVIYTHSGDYPGNVIILEHVLSDRSKIYSMYGHLRYDNTVKLNQVVAKGDVIGHLIYQTIEDSNGNVYDNIHLHWEIRNFRDGGFICNNKHIPAKGYTYPNHPDAFPLNKDYIYPDNPDVLFPIRCERYHNPTEYINNPKTGYCLTYLPANYPKRAWFSTNYWLLCRQGTY